MIWDDERAETENKKKKEKRKKDRERTERGDNKSHSNNGVFQQGNHFEIWKQNSESFPLANSAQDYPVKIDKATRHEIIKVTIKEDGTVLDAFKR